MHSITEEEAAQEKKSFQRVINSFRAYRVYSHLRLNHSKTYIQGLKPSHVHLLKNYLHHLEQVKLALDHNAEFLKALTSDVSNMFEDAQPVEIDSNISKEIAPSQQDIEKVYSTLKQFRREWSAEGETEREQCFSPLLQCAEEFFPSKTTDRSLVKVLIPGAGLGRLPFEFAIRGFASQGNEYSFFMLCASCFILNQCKEANLHTIYPNVHQYCNNLRNEDQLKSVSIPDVNPALAGSNSNFSMTAGNFVEVYGKQKSSWDMVVTCFFIDTAQNVVEYLETIFECLKPGGYWLNIGPLMYHFADMQKQFSMEPSFEDIKNITKELGFEILEEKTGVPTLYCSTPDAMLQYQYKSAFMVCRKPLQSR